MALTERTDIAEQAAQWLARHALGTLDEEAFEAWRQQSPAHAVAFARALSTWDAFDGQQAHLAPASADAPFLSRRRFLTAACGVLAVGVGGGGLFATRAYAWNSRTTAVGEFATFSLPDGSVAALNTDSRISWRFSDAGRAVWIERGEAAFDLRPGPDVVARSADSEVTLTKGRFNLRLRDEALDLLVLSGQAQAGGRIITAASTSGAAGAMSNALISHRATLVRAASPDQIAVATSWQRGEILFHNATLGSAVEEYNRFLSRKIVIVDRDLASIPVGGRFTSTDPAAFLNAISKGLDITVSPSANAYLLTR